MEVLLKPTDSHVLYVLGYPGVCAEVIEIADSDISLGMGKGTDCWVRNAWQAEIQK